MKALENIETGSENIFGAALEKLMEAVKNRYSRRDWTTMLGISEAAISQWIKGRTFPSSDKLEMIITILSDQQLSREEEQQFGEFMAMVENPGRKLWPKIPASLQEGALSEYILQKDKSALDNILSYFYYDLKLEFYQDISRQVSIHKEFLMKDLLKEEANDEDSFYEISMRSRRLRSLFKDENYREYLRFYSLRINVMHRFFNIFLEKYLLEFQDCNHDTAAARDLLLDVFENNYENLYQEYEKKTNRPSGGTIGEKYGNSNNCMDANISSNDFLKLESRGKDECELTFFSPDKSDRELINISLGKVRNDRNEFSEKRAMIYFDFVNQKGINWLEERGSENVIVAEIKDRGNGRGLDKCYINHETNYALNFDLGALSGISGDVNRNELQTLIELMFSKGMSKSDKSNQNMKAILIGPEHTNQKYTVELLGSLSSNRKRESPVDNGVICVIFGELELVSAENRAGNLGQRQALTSLVDKLKLGEKKEKFESCITRIAGDSKYMIKNNGGGYIALLIRDFQAEIKIRERGSAPIHSSN